MQSNLDAAEDKAVASVGQAGELRVSLEVERELAMKLQAQVHVCVCAGRGQGGAAQLGVLGASC